MLFKGYKMQTIKGGVRKNHLTKRPKAPASSINAPEATLEDIMPMRRGTDKSTEESGAFKVPARIEVKQISVKGVVPGHVFRCPPFKFSPQTFITESEKLNNKFIEEAKQIQSLKMFTLNPKLPMIYSVAGNPDDIKAKYFAAYLVLIHLRALGAKANVVWHSLYGGFENKLVSEYADVSAPTMLVLTNLTPISTPLKLEKARDIIERYTDIPRIVVSAGMDPISFLSTRLFLQVNGLAYFSDSLVRQTMEVM